MLGGLATRRPLSKPRQRARVAAGLFTAVLRESGGGAETGPSRPRRAAQGDGLQAAGARQQDLAPSLPPCWAPQLRGLTTLR